MIHIHIKAGAMNRVFATRLSALDVLAALGKMLDDEANYIQIRSYIKAYVEHDPCESIIHIQGESIKVDADDQIEVWFATGSEYFELSEVAAKFSPGSIDKAQVDDAAFQWSIDYKPWEEDLEYRAYARHGFVQGVKWAMRQLDAKGDTSDDVS